MNSVIDMKNKEVKIRADEGRKHVEKTQGVGRLERHPADGLPLKHDPKKGHGGKYTWEGPRKDFEAEDETAELDENDPNYEEVDDGELVVGEVEVAKTAAEGVARLQVDPHLKLN